MIDECLKRLKTE